MRKEIEQSNFQRGVLSMLILSLLQHSDMYGYELVQKIAQISEGAIQTQEGSLYPVLYKLSEEGLLSDEKRLVGKRMQRVYYHLEPAGRAYLQTLITEYKAVTRGVFRILTMEEEENE